MITPRVPAITNMDQVVKKMILNCEGIDPEPTNIGDHTVTYGYGYTFIRNGSNGWARYENLNSDLATIGIELSGSQTNQLNSIARALNQNNLTLADQLITQFQQGWEYVAITPAEAQTLYNLEINRKKDALACKFRKVLGTTNGNTLLSGLQNTNEMVCLLDMAYNGGAGLVGGKLINAMWDGNRAEAWFEIRYNSNNGKSRSPGLAKRRYLESQMFGLYDNPNNISATEAKNIFKMVQNHRSDIVSYEKNYGVPVDGTSPLQGNRIATANNDFSGLLSYVQAGSIQDITSALNPAKTALLADLRASHPEIADKLIDANFVSTNIYLNPHKAIDPYIGYIGSYLTALPYETGNNANGANDLMIGMDQSDDIFGGKGNDILIGEGGNDFLNGGEGNDTLVGGTGFDTYYYRTGDGNDTIIDSGANAIIIEDAEGNRRTITNVYDEVGYWIDATGSIKVTHNSPWKIVLEDGSTITLGENLQSGDFGIDLITPPSQPVTTNIITGTSEPDENLRGTTASDLIDGGAGNDQINVLLYNIDYGGNDWLKGGAGNDLVQAWMGENCIAEGNAGSDYITGGQGDNKLFGDDYGEMAQLIALGETATGIDERGDLIRGYLNADYIYGSNRNDALFGNVGKDLIVGGGGNDFIYGDDYFNSAGSGTLPYFWDDWSFQISDGIVTMTNISYVKNTTGDDDVIHGGTGNDFILAGYGDDEVYGGSDNDTVYGYAGDDFIEGGSNDDFLRGDDAIEGLALEYHGQDYIDGGDGNDVIYGDGGNDDLFGGNGNDTIFGGAGDDYLDGEGGVDVLDGGDGNDVIFGGDGNDTLYGGAGDDYLEGEGGIDVLNGGTGNDEIVYDGEDGNASLYGGEGDDRLTLGAGNDYVEGGTGIDYIDAGDGNNTIFGGSEDDTIIAGAGIDWLQGDEGNDYIDGGAGNSTILGGDGNDELYGGADIDWLQGDAGDDYLEGFEGNDTLLGGDGSDVLFGDDGDDKVQGDAGDDYLDGGTGNDSMLGGVGNDEIFAGDDNDSMWGGNDNDTIYGDAGNDQIAGEAGDDYLDGGIGQDMILGGDGHDTIFASDDDDQVQGDAGNDYLDGGAGNDYILGADGNDEIYGGTGVDSLWGGNDSDTIYGEAGSDQITGEAGDDYLDGGEGDDMIYGGAGNDTLAGGKGNDYLQGMNGNDKYLFSRGDGIVTIDNSAADYASAADFVTFGSNITMSDLEFVSNGANLLINIIGTTDTAIVLNWFSYPNTQFVFADNTTKSLFDIMNLTLNTFYGNDQNNNISGSASDDRLYGKAGNDTLNGGNGNDVLIGGVGDDSLIGGAGNDTYSFGMGDGNDIIYDASGNDSIIITQGLSRDSIAFNLSGAQNDNGIIMHINETGESVRIQNWFTSDDYKIEHFKFADGTEMTDAEVNALAMANGLISTDANDEIWCPDNISEYIFGKAGNDTIYGSTQNDTIDGGAGADVMAGGGGDDVYIVDNVNDTITEYYGSWNDSVFSSVTYSLSSDVENLTLTGTDAINGSGNSGSNLLTGNDAANQLVGNAGNDTLIGGNGADTLIGGTGNDNYVIDHIGVVVSENPDEGVDTIVSSINYTLNENIENLTLTGTDEISGTGNTLANVITGNSAANTLIGGDGNDSLDGGAGADYLLGGAGNDAYTIDDSGDIVVETPDAGTDTVASYVSYTLTDNIENLNLIGDAAINGTGNHLDNIIVGNNAANLIIAGNGLNNVNGAAGNDTIYGGNVRDELHGDAGDDLIYGGAGDDFITGNNGDDTLRGGAGNDYIHGGTNNFNNDAYSGAGNDTYLFGRNDGSDTIYDRDAMAGNIDAILLDGDINPSDVQLYHGPEQGSLWLCINGSDDNIEMVNWALEVFYGSNNEIVAYFGDQYKIEQIQFADGTIWDISTMKNLAVQGTSYDEYIYGFVTADTINAYSGNDYLFGYGGDDMLNGGAGNDTLDGSIGDDTYIFGRGDGQDIINDWSTEASNNDKILFNDDVNTADVIISRSGSDLILSISGTTDKITVSNWFSDTRYRVEQIQFADSTVWDAAYIEQNALAAGTDGNDSLVGTNSSELLEGLAGNDTLTGLAGDDTLDGGTGTDSMYGGSGNDTYIVDNTGDMVTENANDGTDTVRADITYTLGSNVEYLILTGTNAINGTGNTLANTLTGNSAANTLNGGTGADIMIGGDGNDIYVVDNASDIVTENASEGTDTVQSSVTYTLTDNVENLTLTGTTAISGTGNTMDNYLTGNSAANTLTGGAGNDTLNGDTGADTMSGGTGNDTYIRDNTGDVITENAGEGTDTIQTSLAYTLGNNVENLTLTGSSAISGTGNTLDNYLTGNSAANTLTGNAGNDTLNGGAGADSLVGGAGDDIYIVDNTGDKVTESASSGTDTVYSSVSLTLATNVENLILTGTNAINGTGNTLVNTLTGNSAANTLSGGTGADKMIGGAGNDIYVVDNTGDAVTENTGEGTDTVQSSIAYTLGSNVENLSLTGTSAINGTGNTLDNYITGNSAANRLTGYEGNDTLNGGSGADTMIGGAGDDTYVRDNTGDVITENAGEGTDMVQTSLTYTLANNVENLILTGTSTISGTGNTLDNYLTGNSAANTLTGGAGNDTLDGGAGADSLIGGTGNDTYIRDNTSDVITENAGEGTDTVQSSVTYTLGANVENLTLTGSTAINGTGNTLDNYLTGNSADNTLTGDTGNDTLDGGSGSDSLVGGTGNDTYLFRRTDGIDTINDYSTTTTDSDTLNLTDGITSTEPVIVKQDGDLYIFVDSGNYVKIASQFTATTYGIERLEVSDGHYITRSDIETIVNTMSSINDNTGMDVMQKYNAMMADSTYITTLAQTWKAV